MFRFASTMIAALALSGQLALAAPQDDAAEIAAYQMTEGVAAALRASAALWLVRRFDTPLAALDGTITDRERFAAMLPESATDAVLADVHRALADSYADHLSAAELSGIVAFLRTGAARKLRDLAPAQPPLAAGQDFAVRLPGIRPDPYALLDGDFTAEEIAASTAFLTSPAAAALEREVSRLGTAQFFAVTQALMRTNGSETHPDAAWMVPILEADGIVAFPNRVLRQQAIDTVRRPSP